MEDRQRASQMQMDFENINKLAYPNSHLRGVPSATLDNLKILEKYRALDHRYNRRNPLMMYSPGRSGKSQLQNHLALSPMSKINPATL